MQTKIKIERAKEMQTKIKIERARERDADKD